MFVREFPCRGCWKRLWPAVYAPLFFGVLSASVAQGVPGPQVRNDANALTYGGNQQQNSQQNSEDPGTSAAASDLMQGSSLTRQGQFAEAIPLLQRAQAAGISGYAGGFNLAICYMGMGRFRDAVEQLHDLQRSGQNTAAVSNLLAQAYLGAGQPQDAWAAIQAAVKMAPKDEKMYAYLMNACTDHYEYELGLQVTALGLKSLPNSARLHYERAIFLARLDRLEEAKPEFAKAAALDSKGDLGYLARVQVQMYDDDLTGALKTVRDAIKAGHHDYQMLALLGSVLMQTGAIPGQPEFTEAENALESSIAEHPEFSTSQIALGKLYLMEGQPKDAIAHLEIGKRLEPQNPAVYTSLAAAYRRIGNREASEKALQSLAALLREKTNSQASSLIQP